MTKRLTLEVARNLALQKVGRNVVNFQKMEAMLKYILAFANLQSPLSDIAKSITQKTAAIAKRPMGQLVADATKALHRDPDSTPRLPTDLNEVWFSYSFTISETREDAREWRKLMEAVVTERNALIHQMLATFDPNSLESCESLCVKLDEQRSRILQAYEQLESIVLAIRESHRELAKGVDDTGPQGFAKDSPKSA